MNAWIRHAAAVISIAALGACGEKPQPVTSVPVSAGSSASSPASAGVKPSLDAPAFLAGNVPTVRGTCSVDAVAGKPLQQDQPVVASAGTRFEGWAGDTSSGTVPPTAVLELVGSATYFASIQNRGDRPDVAAAHKGGLLRSGWEVEVDTTVLPAGRFGMNIIQSDGKATNRCDTGRSIVISK